MSDPSETFAKVGQTVDYTLPEGETIGGETTFSAVVTKVYDDGETVDLEFTPPPAPGAESEKIVREGVPYGVGTGAWFEHEIGAPAENAPAPGEETGGGI